MKSRKTPEFHAWNCTSIITAIHTYSDTCWFSQTMAPHSVSHSTSFITNATKYTFTEIKCHQQVNSKLKMKRSFFCSSQNLTLHAFIHISSSMWDTLLWIPYLCEFIPKKKLSCSQLPLWWNSFLCCYRKHMTCVRICINTIILIKI